MTFGIKNITFSY